MIDGIIVARPIRPRACRLVEHSGACGIRAALIPGAKSILPGFPTLDRPVAERDAVTRWHLSC